MAKTEKEMMDNYKARINKQNQAIKSNYDKVTSILPKGTVKRIKALGLTINAAINNSLLPYLESLEQPIESTETPLESIKNNEVNTSVDFPELPPVIRETEDEEILALRKEKPNNDYIAFPESIGDLEKDNENFKKYIANVKEMRDKANKERIEIRKIESERGNM